MDAKSTRKCFIFTFREDFKWVLLNPPTTHPPATDQPTTDHLLTDLPTNRPPTHRPNNHRPSRQDFISKTWSMKKIHFTERKQLGRCKTILRSIIYLMNRYLCKISIYLHKIFFFSFLQKKTAFLQTTYGGFNYVHFFTF